MFERRTEERPATDTPAISRKSYVHPKLIDALQDDPRDPLHGLKRPPPRRRLTSAEAAFLAFLKKKARRRRASSTRSAA